MKGYTFSDLWVLFVIVIYNTILLVCTASTVFANENWFLIGCVICFNLYIGRKKEDLSLYQG